ncbi:Plant invertase/pectin methylesterase inhibitor superfamily protein [Raphanus sativus]|uniref:Uncharacterized protein LOC130496313 n=1 Tax=Raphanus sativus TaxID=3726 RepID=A0A9W3BYD3_RAPSA|nr:uncharacterized protein LOC130496313 [Raphanus sativus]KAJ4887515.1 Plant invertase/pectin methylesterase inhibitor superfamily protein [Raphanus sativus]
MMYLIVFAFLFDGCTTNKVADSLIQKSCKKASKFPGGNMIPDFEKVCLASLKENPKSQKVRNLGDLTIVGANNAISNLTNVKRMVEKIIKERKYKNSLTKRLLEECLKLYSNSYKALTLGLNYAKMQKFDKASDEFMNAEDGPPFCGLKFNGDNQQISPVKEENIFLITMLQIPDFLAWEAKYEQEGRNK